MAHQRPSAPPVTEDQREAWNREVETVAAAIDGAWKRLKEQKLGKQ